LIKAIDKSKNVKLDKYIYALGIPNVGRSASKTISKYFDNSWDKFEDACLVGFDFTVLEDFGQTMHDNIIDWYNNTDEQKMLFSLFNIVSIVKEEKKEIGIVNDNIFKNKKVYASGTFENYKKNEIKVVLEGLGAEFATGYSKKLSYLIMGKLKGSSKEAKAIKDGIPVITEDEFIKMI